MIVKRKMTHKGVKYLEGTGKNDILQGGKDDKNSRCQKLL